jgi:proline racemase
MFHAVETHSGLPMRVVTGGVPTIPGETVYQQMQWLAKNDDQLRLLMLREPADNNTLDGQASAQSPRTWARCRAISAAALSGSPESTASSRSKCSSDVVMSLPSSASARSP